MSSARARGLATRSPVSTPERAALLRIQAFTLGQEQAPEVSPRRESDTAPPLAVSEDVVAETLSRSKNTETGLPARVTIGDEVSPLTIDTSIPVSTENSGSLHLYCGVIAVLLLMHIKYEGYGLWPVSESHGGGCTPPLEHTRSITKGEALAPACKASGAGALTGRSSPSSAEHTRAVILHYRTYGRYHISTPPDRNAVATPVWFSVCTRTSSAVARASQLAYRQVRWQPLTPPSASRRCADSSPVIHAL